MEDRLFYNDNRANLSDALRARMEKMKADIGDTPPPQMNGATDEELATHFVAKYRIEPLTIHDDRAEAEPEGSYGAFVLGRMRMNDSTQSRNVRNGRQGVQGGDRQATAMMP